MPGILPPPPPFQKALSTKIQEEPKTLREYDQTRCRQDTKDLCARMFSLCAELEGAPDVSHVDVSEFNKSKSGFAYLLGLLAGGLTSKVKAPTHDLAWVDSLNNGNEPKGGGIMLVLLESIENASNHDLTLLDSPHKRKILDFQRAIDEYKEGNTFQRFDSRRVFSNIPVTIYNGPRDLERLARCRVPEINLLLASLLLADSNKDEYAKMCGRLISEWPQSRAIDKEKFGSAYWGMASATYEFGDKKRALELAEKGLEYNRSDGDLWEVAGLAQFGLGNREEAKKDIQSALEMNPENGRYNIAMAQVLCVGFQDKNWAFEHIRRAYKKGYSDIADIRKCPAFESLHSDGQFAELTTVKVAWGVQKGISFSDIWMKNESPFRITNAKLESTTAGWSWVLPKDGKTIVLEPGETFKERFYSQPPAGASPTARATCDQDE